MKRLLGALLVASFFASPVYAGSLAVTPGSGATVGTGTDGTNQIPATILCGATSSATLYATCVNQAIVNASGQLLTLDSQSGTWNITNISGTVSLPTGASTAANQPTNASQGSTTSGQTGNLDMCAVVSAAPTLTAGQTNPCTMTTGGSLHTTVDNTNANGQATMANSSPVVIASNQSAVPVSAASGAFASGSIASGALAAGSIASGAAVSGAFVAGSIADLAHGQGTMAASVPVAIASNQSAVPTSLNATPSLANGNGVVPTQGGSVLSATNGGYQNVLQGNAVLSATNPIFSQPVAGTAGGASQTGNIVANNTTAVVVKASAGTLYSIQLYGIGSAPAYLKIYNATSATCGSGTPVARYMIPAASTAANGAGSNIDLGPTGVAYSTGITYCVTTGITDADTTAPAASTFLVNLAWK